MEKNPKKTKSVKKSTKGSGKKVIMSTRERMIQRKKELLERGSGSGLLFPKMVL